jgi:RNA polymerase sigma-70 factor (ECF subfamily)
VERSSAGWRRGATAPVAGDPPDDVLVARLIEGDEAALGLLYRRYVGPIYRFVLAQVRHEADAEDLTAETFARMMRAIGRFRGEASFKNWLYQIARNAVRNHRRAAHYRLSVPLSPRIPDPRPVQEEGGKAIDREIVQALLDPLPPRYRLVLELRFLHGLTIAQTAERMAITPGNCKVLQHRALRKAAAHAAATQAKSGSTQAKQEQESEREQEQQEVGRVPR